MKNVFCVTSTLSELLFLNLCYLGHVQNTQRVKIYINRILMCALEKIDCEFGSTINCKNLKITVDSIQYTAYRKFFKSIKL